MSLRHCLSSDGSERGVPKEAKTLSKSMGAYQSLLFQLAMQFGGWLGVLRRVKIVVSCFMVSSLSRFLLSPFWISLRGFSSLTCHAWVTVSSRRPRGARRRRR